MAEILVKIRIFLKFFSAIFSEIFPTIFFPILSKTCLILPVYFKIGENHCFKMSAFYNAKVMQKYGLSWYYFQLENLLNENQLQSIITCV